MKVLVTLGVGLFFIYLSLIIFVYIVQRKLQYFPTHRDSTSSGNRNFSPWKSRGGDFLGYVREAENPKRAFIFFHGNGGEALDREWLTELIPDRHVVILLAEYPGYGSKDGELSENSFQETAKIQMKEALEQFKVPLSLAAESLGTGVACHVASQFPVDRIALIAPFSSAVDVARFHYPFLPVSLLMKDKFLCLGHMSSVKVPLHIVHGTLDEIVPIHLGRKLFEAYPGPQKKMTEIPGYEHNNIIPAILNSPLAEGFRDFVNKD